jgi:hypothetical protein
MKKTIIILVTMALSLSSCSTNDEAPNLQSSIVGKWDLTAKTMGTTSIALSACEIQYSYFECFKNNTLIEDEGYSNDGKTCAHYTYEYTYTIENNVLTTKEIKGTYQHESRYNITELTSTKLKTKLFYSKEVDNGTIYEDTFPENKQITFSFEKIK